MNSSKGSSSTCRSMHNEVSVKTSNVGLILTTFRRYTVNWLLSPAACQHYADFILKSENKRPKWFKAALTINGFVGKHKFQVNVYNNLSKFPNFPLQSYVHCKLCMNFAYSCCPFFTSFLELCTLTYFLDYQYFIQTQ